MSLYRTAGEQLSVFKNIMKGRKLRSDSKIFTGVVGWLKVYPHTLKPEEQHEVRNLICECFSVSPQQLEQALLAAEANPHQTSVGETEDGTERTGEEIELQLNSLLPSGGYIRRYVDYTLFCEPPLAYHLFCALSGVACVVNRRVYLNMGYFNIFPPLGIIILGPSGIKKTSAADIVVGMLSELNLTKIYADKLTPEALVEAMKGENATGLIYAPEMATFLGKQKYNEGMIPLLTRLMDCPSVWKSETIMRAQTVLYNVALSSLMCSTLDWFIKNTPEDTFGGGFVARNLMIVQYTSPRVRAVPRPGDPADRDRLKEELAYMHELQGEMVPHPQLYRLEGDQERGTYADWYYEFKKTHQLQGEHNILVTYYQRKPTHLLRLAMSFHIAQHHTLTLCTECFERALAVLDWTERFLPGMVRELFKTSEGIEQEDVLRVIRTNGNHIKHSDLVRRLGYKMNAQQVRNVIGTLKEQQRLKEENNALGHFYTLLGE